MTAPIPTDGEEHTLLVRNDYSSLHSEYQLELLAGPGVRAKQESNAGKNMVVSFRTDASLAPGPTTQAGFSVTTAASSGSWLDQNRDHWLWLVLGAMFGAVGIWLALVRRRDQAARPVAVRQIQASRKKPVAVRTIEAPDE